jgi:predicted HTH domain antitoxin
MIPMGVVLSVRIDQELESKLELIMKKKKIVDKSAYIRQLISRSVTQDILDYLSEEVSANQMSAWRAAQIAGISLRSMMKELSKRGVESYGERELAEDLLFSKS